MIPLNQIGHRCLCHERVFASLSEFIANDHILIRAMITMVKYSLAPQPHTVDTCTVLLSLRAPAHFGVKVVLPSWRRVWCKVEVSWKQ